MSVLMRPLWEVVSGQRCHPLAHLLLNEQHLRVRETCKGLGLQTADFHVRSSSNATRPTSVALPWLRACSVKLQLLWMCSFPCRSAES